MKNYVKVFIIGLKYLRSWLDKDSHLCIFAFCILSFPIISYQLIQDNNLNQRKAYALGIITKMDDSGKGARKIYEFYIDNKTYVATAPWGGLTKIREGDSIIVEYEYTNPKNNEINCYFERSLDRNKLPDTVYYRQIIDEQRKPIKNE